MGAGGGRCERTSISPAELSKLAFDKRVEGAEQRDGWGMGRGGAEVGVGRRSPLLQLTGEWIFFFLSESSRGTAGCLRNTSESN